MKHRRLLNALLVAASVAAGVWCAPVSGQVPNASPPGVNATLAKLFANFSGFTAKVNIRVLDKDQNETTATPMDFAFLDKKVRMDVDLSKLRSKQLTPEMALQIKQSGMEQLSTILRPDKRETYTALHAVRACLVSPMAPEELDAMAKPPKVEKTTLGKETIDGHPCVKTQLVMTDGKGEKREALTWNATDLKEFPIQIQTTEKENTLVMHFTEVQLTKPDASRFDPPAGYATYKDMQELMMGVMKKMMSGGGK